MEDKTKYKDSIVHIKQRVLMAKDFSKGWHENIKKWRRLYDGDHYDKDPKPGEHQFSDPTHTNTVDLAVGMFQSNQHIWRAVSWSPTDEDPDDTDSIEKFLAGIIQINNDRNQYNIAYEVNLHFVRDGGAVLYAPYDPVLAFSSLRKRNVPNRNLDTMERQPTIEEQFMQEPPIRTEVIDPLKMFFLPGGPLRWSTVMRIEDMSIYDVEAKFGVTIEKYSNLTTEQKIQKRGEFIDYWDIAYEDHSSVSTEPVMVTSQSPRKMIIRNAVLFEDQFILHPEQPLLEMRGYVDFPYTVSFFKPTLRDDSSSWYSILAPLESTIAALEKAINRRQRQIDVYTAMPLVARTTGDRVIDMDPGIGKVVQLNEDEDLAFPQWQGNPPDVREQVDFYRGKVEQSGFSSVMFGSGASQVSGYALSQLGDQNRIRLEQPVTHLEQLWTWWARKVMCLTAYWASDSFIRVYGRIREADFATEVKGADLLNFQVTCEIKPDFPNEAVRKHAMATQAAAFLSVGTIMQDYLDIQQPEEERKRKLLEEIQNSPEAKQFAIMQNLAARAQDGDKVAAMMLQQMQQSSAPAQQQSAGRNPEQPLGLQFPDGKAPPQSRSNTKPGEGAGDMSNRMQNASPGMDGSII